MLVLLVLLLLHFQLGDEGFEAEEVPIILNVDIDGMLEPIENMIASIPDEEVKAKIVLKQVSVQTSKMGQSS